MIVKSAHPHLRLLQLALVLITPIYLIRLIIEQHVTLPVWDQWVLVDMMDKLFSNTLIASDIWAQHNEIRIPIPKIIILGMAYLSHWNMFWELVFNISFGALCFLLFLYQVNNTHQQLNRTPAMWLHPVLALLIFSLAQWENWVWGFSINGFVATLCIIATLYYLSLPNLRWPHLFAAIFFLIITMLSTIGGFLLWGIGCLILAITGRNLTYKYKPLLIWVVFGVVALIIYFVDYTPYTIPGGLDESKRSQPLEYIYYILNYFGNPLMHATPHEKYAWLAGLAGLVAFIYLPLELIRSNKANLQQLLPYLGLGLYAIGIALLAAFGRVGYNDGLSSRYVSTGLWLWASVFVFLDLHTSMANEARTQKYQGATIGFLILLLCALLSADLFGLMWKYQNTPLWPFIGASILAVAVYNFLVRQRTNPHPNIPQLTMYIVLFLATLITESSLRYSRLEANWYQSKHIKPAIDIILLSQDPSRAPDAALKTLSPEFPAEVTRRRLLVLAHHQLAAYRRDD